VKSGAIILIAYPAHFTIFFKILLYINAGADDNF